MQEIKEIKGFQGDYRFLSNFYPCQVYWNGHTYASSEAAYQSSKAIDKETESKFTSLNPRQARSHGRSIPIREDWEKEKLNVMYRLLRKKFTQNKVLGIRLLDTGEAHLEETNYWHDTFWGVYNGVGENHLGRLLMLVRDELREGIVA